jgi:hypothetical protein
MLATLLDGRESTQFTVKGMPPVFVEHLGNLHGDYEAQAQHL